MTDKTVPLTESEILTMLEQLVGLQQAVNDLRAARTKLELAAIPDEVNARLAEIADEFSPKLEVAATAQAGMESAIRAAVIRLGASVKGVGMHATYSPGRPKWDDRKLVRYAQDHPEILICREQGDAFVSLRPVAIKAEDMAPKEEK